MPDNTSPVDWRAFTQKTWVIVLAGLLLPPIGMILVWLKPEWTARTKWIATGLMAVMLMGYLNGGRRELRQEETSAASSDVAGSLVADKDAVGTQSDAEMAEATRDMEAENESSKQMSTLYAQVAKQLKNAGLKEMGGPNAAEVIQEISSQAPADTGINAASIWYMTDGEDDAVVLLLEWKPINPDSYMFGDPLRTRMYLSTIVRLSRSLLLRLSMGDEDLSNALLFGYANGNRYVKTYANGSTEWKMVLVFGPEIAEVTCGSAEKRHYPESSPSSAVLSYNDLITTCGTEQFEDFRPSTAEQIKALLCGKSVEN